LTIVTCRFGGAEEFAIGFLVRWFHLPNCHHQAVASHKSATWNSTVAADRGQVWPIL